MVIVCGQPVAVYPVTGLVPVYGVKLANPISANRKHCDLCLMLRVSQLRHYKQFKSRLERQLNSIRRRT